MSFFFKMISSGLKSKRFFIALGIILISMGISWTAFREDAIPLFEHDYILAFTHGYCGWTSLLAGLAPLIATIPFAAQHVENCKSGMMKYVVSRMGEKKYFNSMFFANVCLTAVTFIVGMALFFLVSVLLFSKNVDINAFYGLLGRSTYIEVAYVSPILYVITIIAHCAFVAIAFSSIGFAFSFLIKNKFVAWISAFIIAILMSLFAMFLNLVKLEPMSIFDVHRASGTTFWLVVCYVLVITVLSYLLAKTRFRMAMIKDEEV